MFPTPVLPTPTRPDPIVGPATTPSLNAPAGAPTNTVGHPAALASIVRAAATEAGAMQPETLDAETSQRALMLQAGVLSHDSLAASATRFATELALAFGCSRVTLGFVQRGSVEVVAVSHGGGEPLVGETFDTIASAMDEAVQQGSSIHLPVEAGSRSLIRLAHHRWAQRQGGTLASVPLLHAGEVVGALSCEWVAERSGLPALVGQLETIVSLVGPVLHLMHLRELPLRLRASLAVRRGWQRLHTADDRRLPMVLGGAVLVAAVLCLLPVDYQVGGQARIDGEQQRALVAPTDGFLKAVHVRPGDRVRQGQLLLEMAEQDMTLERRKWSSELAQQESAYATALSRADRAAMVIALARAEQARAQLAMIEGELARAAIVAPFDGVVIQGDLAQSVGAPLERGKPLMLVAPGESYRAVIEIDERDVAELQPGQLGALSLSALPWDRLPLRVTRVTPIARPVDGHNVFEVEASIEGDAGRIRPGLEGVARITVGVRPLGWSWAHRLVGWLRITAWSWWGA